MATVLIVIHLMVVAALVVVVLLQRSEGGALGIGGGGGGAGGFMSGRGTANALTRATAILAGIFFLTSLGLTLLATSKRQPTSVFEDAARRPAQSAPAKPGQKPADGKSSSPSLFDQLKRQDNAAGAPPAKPAGATPPSPPAAPAAGSPPTPPAGK